MASGSMAGLRVSRAFRMPAARWSGRTSASDPFTLPMGVRQASTTNTGLTLTYLRRDAYHLTIKHGAAALDVLGRRAVWGLSCLDRVASRACDHAPAGACHQARRGLLACVPVAWPANGLVPVSAVVAAPVAACWVRL